LPTTTSPVISRRCFVSRCISDRCAASSLSPTSASPLKLVGGAVGMEIAGSTRVEEAILLFTFKVLTVRLI
jgi:hypothetical protein